MHDHEANIHPVKLAAVTPESKLHCASVRVRFGACHPQTVTFSVPEQASSETLCVRLWFVNPVTASLAAGLLCQKSVLSSRSNCCLLVVLVAACRNSHLFTLRILLALLGPSSSSRQTTPPSFLGFCGSSRVDRWSQPRPEAELQSAESAGALFYSLSSPSLFSSSCPASPLEVFLLLDASKTDEADRRIRPRTEQQSTGRPDKARLGAKCRSDTQRSRPSQKHRPQTPKGTRERLCKKNGESNSKAWSDRVL